MKKEKKCEHDWETGVINFLPDEERTKLFPKFKKIHIDLCKKCCKIQKHEGYHFYYI